MASGAEHRKDVTMAKFKPTRAFAGTRPALSLFSTPQPLTPPSERVVAAVLEFGDVREDRQDGLTTVRFTAARLEREDMELLLGEERERALDVSIIWDEAECEMVRVIDLAPLRAGREGAEQANRYADARKRTFRRTMTPAHAAAA
jgi:hypothetical protein